MIAKIFPSSSPVRRMAAATALITALIFVLALKAAFAADAPADPDVLVFSNGDQLTGKLLSSAAGSVKFHSDMAGDLSVDWKNIKEIRTQQKFAVLEKGVRPTRKSPEALVPQGTVTIADQNVQVHTASGGTTPPIPVGTIDFLVDDPTFQSKIEKQPGFFHDWTGNATFGASIVQATQNTYTFNTAVTLVRKEPDVPWLEPRNRTTGDFSQSYGKITDPAYVDPTAGFVPENTVKTSIFHGDFERDEYISDRLYGLGAVAYDHNFSQSLQLQQIYGGGIGYTIMKRPRQTLDLKALVQYEKQEFINPAAGENQNLIGSTFSAAYALHVTKNILFTQQAAYIPAWNNLHAYSVTEVDSFSIPAYKQLSITLGTLDSYLNNPAIALPPVKRNSFQFTAGITYNFK